MLKISINTSIQSLNYEKGVKSTLSQLEESTDLKLSSFNAKKELYVCRHGSYGHLNNILNENMAGIYVANKLGGKFVMGKRLSTLFNISLLNTWNPSAISYNKNILKSCKKLGLSFTLPSNDIHSSEMETLLGSWQKNLDTKEVKYIKLPSEHLFHFHSSMSEYISFQKMFYRNLQVSSAIDNPVKTFIRETLGDLPYVAIHVRSLEKSCRSRFNRIDQSLLPPEVSKDEMKRHCHLNMKTVASIFKDVFQLKSSTKYLASFNSLAYMKTQSMVYVRLFIASDKQKPQIDDSYFASNVPTIQAIDGRKVRFLPVRYDIKCSDNMCAQIDFEIATRAALFIGNYASSASRNIARFRSFRDKPDWEKEMLPNILYSTSTTTLSYFHDTNDDLYTKLLLR